MLVLKFGGTSVGSVESIRGIIRILSDAEHKNRVRVVVVSAFSKVTDTLVEAARMAEKNDGSYIKLLQTLKTRHVQTAEQLLSDHYPESFPFIEASFKELSAILDGIAVLGELTPRTLDHVMSFGERLSACIIARAFSVHGIPSDYLDARLVVKTDTQYGSARYLPELSNPLIQAMLSERTALQVVTGFIASSSEAHTSTLGRGGSDLSAAIFASAIGAEEVEIWTDVDGILSADPRLVKSAFSLESISYIEAMELSHFGAKVLHPPTVRPALEKGIPIRIRNTFNPQSRGTLISNEALPSTYPVRGVSSMRDIALLRLQGSGMMGVSGFSARLFGAMARKKINIILITQSSSEYSICFAVLQKDAVPAASAIKEEFERELASNQIEEPAIERDVAIIAVVGERMKSSPGIAGKVFHALGRNGINIIAIAQGSSEFNISAIISRHDEAKALNAVHEAFFLSGVRSVNLFLVGTGLIGGTLLEQLSNQREILADRHKIRINLIGAANSRKMYFNPEGIDPSLTKNLLASDGEAMDYSRFIERMKSLNLPNSAFCDCTASQDVADLYQKILYSAIPVITPNKRANSGSFDYYRSLTDFSRDSGIPYLYETTVCAGLPVISTLHDLFLSGDTVRRIEAVLSGTLSFIFNSFDGSRPFSELVRLAKEKGYTEPDPRDDLNAMDAARKALVLARECGMSLEFDAVHIEPILPESCFKAPDIEGFFDELKKADDDFEQKRKAAEAGNKVLRYVAVIEDGKASIALRAEDESSPFRSLTDADNIVVITSDRYSVLPLVVKGPGAGAQVTAGGVFADIVRIARTLV